ncbi:MAG: sulfatase-like hydrolase/transferase [Cellulosilyticaceae bacterium]
MKKPNILLITSDQQHYNTIGKFNSEIQTPNLDRLVNKGMCFDRAYTVNPTCTPTRCSLITGKYPSQHGAWTLGTKLREDELTIGKVLQEEGYETALIGKAHFQQLRGSKEYPSLEAYPILQDLDFWKNFNQDFYGFKHVELARNHTCESHVGQHYALWLEEQGCENWKDYFVKPTGHVERNSIRHKWKIKEEYHYDTWIAERTNAKLEEYKEKGENFFIWASFFDPHPPYLVPEPWDTMYDKEDITSSKLREGEHEKNPPYFKMTQEETPDFSAFDESGMCIHGLESHLVEATLLEKDKKVYYAMISLMDKYIGKILDKLDELGLSEETIVVFTTDHGHFLGQHGLIAKGPFMYDDLIKVPLIVRWTGNIEEGVVNHSLQSLVDIPTTLLSLLDIEKPYEMTGLDESQVWLSQKEKIRDHIICEHRHEETTVNMKTYVGERYKLTVYYNQTYGQLFDLQNDPEETNNLWDDEEAREIKQELLLKYIWAEMGKESMYMPRIWHA